MQELCILYRAAHSDMTMLMWLPLLNSNFIWSAYSVYTLHLHHLYSDHFQFYFSPFSSWQNEIWIDYELCSICRLSLIIDVKLTLCSQVLKTNWFKFQIFRPQLWTLNVLVISASISLVYINSELLPCHTCLHLWEAIELRKFVLNLKSPGSCNIYSSHSCKYCSHQLLIFGSSCCSAFKLAFWLPFVLC